MNQPTQLSDIPASIPENIRASAVDALQLTGITITRERLHPVEQASLPAIGVYFRDVTPVGIGSDYRAPQVEREMEMTCEARAIAVDSNAEIAPSLALDPLLTWMTYALYHDDRFAGEQPTRLVNDIFEKETLPYSREADKPIASVSRIFTIKYRTSRLDPTSRG